MARWGVAEWIERPLLMLEVRGSNPGHSASKNTTSLPQNPSVPIRGRVQLLILELGDEAREKAKKAMESYIVCIETKHWIPGQIF